MPPCTTTTVSPAAAGKTNVLAVIGVIAFQGDFSKHLECIARIGHVAVAVRRPQELDRLDGLIIPGGESTTIGMLMERFELSDAIRARVAEGMGVFGTCAGAILMATGINGSDQPRLGLLDMDVTRNAYGRQIESFETAVKLNGNADEPLAAVFIRAPVITRTGPGILVLARFEARAILVSSNRLLAATFHPELTGDLRIHRAFAAMITG